MQPNGIPLREEVEPRDRWDLSSLFATEADWERSLEDLASQQIGIEGLRQKIGKSVEDFIFCLDSYSKYMRQDERLGNYASLRMAEDEGNSLSRKRYSRYLSISSQGQAAWSWLAPAILGLSEDFLALSFSAAEFSGFRTFVSRTRRFKPHTLSPSEERILALQSECNQTAKETFGVLSNVDLDFGALEVDGEKRPLTQSTFTSFMKNGDRSVRERAYRQFYAEFDRHKQTLASLYSGSIKVDEFQARVRGYGSARELALFPDDVSETVYDTLVSTIEDNLGALHSYYDLRKRILGLPELRHYDVYVSLASEKAEEYPYEKAVDIVAEALSPLGDDYVATLRSGLLGGWVDRYENKGKRSGAFSSGGYDGDPYILLNYKQGVMRDVFTLAHEGGHSMHTWYSRKNNPFLSYSYTIFEAEVASTFNEQLLFEYLYNSAKSRETKLSLLAHKIDDTLATLFRQTMFAEYEAKLHTLVEGGAALALDTFRGEYRSLLEKYFGPSVALEDVSDLEGLRIPHFYSAFYVYKYATGISASLALSEKVLRGGERERKQYRAFLESGGSRFPLESLKVAGVDMSNTEPIAAACGRFRKDVKELEELADL